MSPAAGERADAGPGDLIERRGVVASVTLPGADDATVFRAALADRLPEPGSVTPAESLQLVWHGRRRVPGVMPGQWLAVRGRLTRPDGVPTLHNPAFDLIDAPEAALRARPPREESP
ncbi:hypothetical protein [Micrococcus endophyticus]|uniref:hypothetical protein n=1 Tax=Micrococcus endophyticus TaxID=455343 RepID=UPI00200484AD